MIDERIFLSADLGDGGGGAAGGGEAAAAETAVAAEGVETASEAQASQPFDYEGLAKDYGGPEGMKQALQFARDFHLRTQFNPQFKETVEKALKGEYGPEKQAQAQQQQAAQQQPQKPQVDRAAMQGFYKDLQRAQQSGDQEAVRAVFDDPMNAKAKEAYLAHQEQRTQEWWDPDTAWDNRLNSPQTQQWLQQQFQQQIEPIQQQMNHQMKQLWYSNPQNKQLLDTLPQNVQQAFLRGYYGAGPDAPYAEWIQAVQAAAEDAKRQMAQGVPQQGQTGTQVRDVPSPKQKDEPRSGGGKKPEPSIGDGAREYAIAMKKARSKENS